MVGVGSTPVQRQRKCIWNELRSWVSAAAAAAAGEQEQRKHTALQSLCDIMQDLAHQNRVQPPVVCSKIQQCSQHVCM
jgi:hypothetical protein